MRWSLGTPDDRPASESGPRTKSQEHDPGNHNDGVHAHVVDCAGTRSVVVEGWLSGASIIQAASFDDATRIAKCSPSVAFGGRVEVFEQF
jgi:hypothetical protein